MSIPTNGRGVLECEELDAGHRRTRVITELSLSIRKGTITALVGPNGSGKSTLLMTLARALAAQGGTVLLDGSRIQDQPTRQVARRLAFLPQSRVVPPGSTVRSIVEQGRYPQVGNWAMLRRQDDPAVERALALTGLEGLADRRMDSLSGGERQRGWIAMALAQEAGLLLLDEPTAYLDVRHQIDLMELIGQLRRDHDITVVMVLHDLNQAARYADRVVVLRQGQIAADGSPEEVMTPQMLLDVFDVSATIIRDPVTDRPLFLAH